MYYQPTPSTSIPSPVARLYRLANFERSLKQSLVMFEQQTTRAAAPGKSHKCMCTTCTRSTRNFLILCVLPFYNLKLFIIVFFYIFFLAIHSPFLLNVKNIHFNWKMLFPNTPSGIKFVFYRQTRDNIPN